MSVVEFFQPGDLRSVTKKGMPIWCKHAGYGIPDALPKGEIFCILRPTDDESPAAMFTKYDAQITVTRILCSKGIQELYYNHVTGCSMPCT